MNKNGTQASDELEKILADFKRDQIEDIYRIVKFRKICCVIAVLLLLQGLYVLYWKVTDKIFDLNFYLILTGVLYLLSMIIYYIKLLRPSYIESQKKKICEIGRKKNVAA